MLNNTTLLKSVLFIPLLVIVLFILPDNVLADHSAFTQGKKVLVVASYHKEYKWTSDIIDTLKQQLSGAELTFFYMDTKKDLTGAEAKGKEAYSLYLKLQPDAVISVDDNAQSYFVVPYLKDKVKTPVFFCGVNDEASKYGFPATNVTGVIEKKHYKESISFAQMIEPRVSTIGVIYKPGPSNRVNIAQIEKEKGEYTADIAVSIAVQTVADVHKALRDHSPSVDGFILLNMSGITDENNIQIEGNDAIRMIANSTDLVTIGASDWEIEAGALCGVIKSGREQGMLVAHQLLAHWEGKELKDLSLVQNMDGKRYINLSTMKKLKIELRPEMVVGTKIVSGR